MTYQDTLAQLGLSSEQAQIYELILGIGTVPARILVTKSGLKRGLLYKVLDQLVELDLVTKIERPHKVTLFSPKHPHHLRDLLSDEKARLSQAENSLEGIMGNLSSSFNLLSGKPNVQFMEGTAGIQKVLNDTLGVRDQEIYTIVDIRDIKGSMQEINEAYVKRREKLGIKKKILVVRSDEAKEYFSFLNNDTADIRYINQENSDRMHAVTQIYAGKVAYITIKGEQLISVIIEDKRIYDLNVYLFKALFKSGRSI